MSPIDRYMVSVEPDKIAYVDIFPPINIARVGDSIDRDNYYLGPEVPGVEPTPEGGVKDSEQRIRRQAARFCVYAYDKNSDLLGEIIDDDEYSLTWAVHVANKKAAWVKFRSRHEEDEWSLGNPKKWELRNSTIQGWPNQDPERNYEYTNTRTRLIIDPGEKRVSKKKDTEPVPLTGRFRVSGKKGVRVHLGSLETDEDGRLIFVPSNGKSFKIRGNEDAQLESEMDNDGWVDSTSDGTVRVMVRSKKNPHTDIPLKHKATIITAPPKFTPGLQCPTSLLDLIEEVYEKQKRGPGYDVGIVNFYQHIYPIFERMYLISWTNLRAVHGHGPMKAEYFLNNRDLFDPEAGPEAERVRKRVLNQIRVPVQEGNLANEQKRTAQAHSYFMPRLSGNGGDMPEHTWEWRKNHRNQYASVTQLQYDRLTKWANGLFITGEREKSYSSFHNIPLEDRPSALTRAALEWSVGTPLHPGIEVGWSAELEEMYDLSSRYRFAESVKPGDIGKGLCLPWQSDMFMCNTHWWPSIRPDQVVKKEYYEDIKGRFNDDLVVFNLTQRVAWDRGLEKSGTKAPPESDNSDSEDFDIKGASDMVRKWGKLGFIIRQESTPGSTSLPIHVEMERHSDLHE